MKSDDVPEMLRDRWTSRKGAAVELTLSKTTVDRLIKAKRLKVKLYEGGRVFVSKDSTRAFLQPFLR